MSTAKKQKSQKRRPKGTGTIYYDQNRKRYMGQTTVEYGDGTLRKKTVSGSIDLSK